jgi:hypothetical protein
MSIEVNGVELSDVTVRYLETILWAETVSLSEAEDMLSDGFMDVAEDHPLYNVQECSPLDDHFGLGDFSVESLKRAENDCNEFFYRLDRIGLLERANCFADDEHIAYDFWLTRQGHGAGFWDGDYADETEDIGDALTGVAREFGECWVIVDDAGCLHIEG